jgi:hypothetical protein
VSCHLQILESVHGKLVVNPARKLRTDAGNSGEQQIRGDFAFQSVEKVEPVTLHELPHVSGNRAADGG